MFVSPLVGPPDNPPELPEYPFVSILIPCFNEGDNVRETIAWAHGQKYPDFEVIAINDGSTDETAAILDELRSIASKEDEFSKFKPYCKESEKLIYNSKIIDGLKLKFKYTTVTVNARHKFF